MSFNYMSPFKEVRLPKKWTKIPVSQHHTQKCHSAVLVLSVLKWLQEQQIKLASPKLVTRARDYIHMSLFNTIRYLPLAP